MEKLIMLMVEVIEDSLRMTICMVKEHTPGLMVEVIEDSLRMTI
jgi:hypothetical protein